MFDIIVDTCGALCHQLADRSFFPAGSKLPFCARCTGIYVNIALAFGFTLWAAGPAFRLTRVRIAWLIFGVSLVMLVLGWIAGFFVPSLLLQYLSGIPFAWAATLLLVHTFNGLFWKTPNPWTGRPAALAAAAILASANAALLVTSPLVFYVFSWGSVTGALIGFGLLNGIILLNIFVLQQNTFTRRIQFVGILGISFVLVGVETIVYGWILR